MLLFLGSNLGKNLNPRSATKKRVCFANRCFLCQVNEETENHLLFHCDVTRVLWELLFSLFGISWVNPLLVWDTLLGWKVSFAKEDRKIVWKVGPLCIFWTVRICV